MYIGLLILVIGLKTLLCKGTALGSILLLFWIKGRRLRFHSKEWEDFFLSLPAEKIQKYAVGIYFTAAALSSAVSYFILRLLGYRYSLGIALLIFAGGFVITAYRWRVKGKDDLLKRYQEIPRTILEKRERERTDERKGKVILREYWKSDYEALENIVRTTWKYDRFCSPKTAEKMAKVYLNSCLMNQTFARVAELDGAPVGIIMGKNSQIHKRSLLLYIKWIQSILSLYMSKEGREISKIFEGVQGIDKELLSACEKAYKGELAFFAISEACRGKGFGRLLFQTVVDYMKSQKIHEFYLFTDTSCNYPFYEHLGMTRRCEKRQSVDVKGEKGDMTFFLYDYQIKEEGGEP